MNSCPHEKTWAKRDGLGDDISRIRSCRPKCAVTHSDLRTAGPRRNRCKELIYGSSPPVTSRQYLVFCPVCGGPKMVISRKKERPEAPKLVPSYLKGIAFQGLTYPKYQQHFEEWLATAIGSGTDSSTQIQREGLLKSVLRHHYRHHKDHKEPAPSEPKRRILTCIDCPNFYEPWTRKKHADHFYNGGYLSLPLEAKKVPKEKPSHSISASTRYIGKNLTESETNELELKTSLRNILIKGTSVDEANAFPDVRKKKEN